MAKAYGIDPREILEAKTIEEQRAIFETKFAPIFEKKFLRWLVDQPAALFGFGIPPAQYDLLAADDAQGITGALKSRLREAGLRFRLQGQLFRLAGVRPRLWQACRCAAAALSAEGELRRGGRARRARRDPPREYADYLERMPAQSLDRYILLDAQDWMTDEQLTRIWSEITRTAKPGARVLYRTAAVPDVVEGHVPATIMDQWEYADAGEARRLDEARPFGGLWRDAPLDAEAARMTDGRGRRRRKR